MDIRYLRAAEQELHDAFLWYEEKREGLGYDFLKAFTQALERVVVYPEVYMLISDGLRRALVAKYPYGIIYGIEEDTIIIVAVSHLHREPFYWDKRVE